MKATTMSTPTVHKPKSKPTPSHIPDPQEFISKPSAPQHVVRNATSGGSGRSVLFFIAGLFSALAIVAVLKLVVLPAVWSQEAVASEATVTPTPSVVDTTHSIVDSSMAVSAITPAIEPQVEIIDAARVATEPSAAISSVDEDSIDAYVAQALAMIEEAQVGIATDAPATVNYNALDSLIDAGPIAGPQQMSGSVAAAIAPLPEGGPKWKYNPMDVNKSAHVGSLFNFYIEWNYPEELFNKGILWFEVVSAPDWLQVNHKTGQVTGTPGPGDVGRADVVLRMSDGMHAPDDLSFTLQVLSAQ